MRLGNAGSDVAIDDLASAPTIDMSRSNGVFLANHCSSPWRLVSTADIIDGTSATFLVGEAIFSSTAAEGCVDCHRFALYNPEFAG